MRRDHVVVEGDDKVFDAAFFAGGDYFCNISVPLRFQRNYDLVNGRSAEYALEIIIVIHYLINLEPELRLVTQILTVLLCQPSAADQNFMLDVVPGLADLIEHHPRYNLLGTQHEVCQRIENGDDTTGYVLDLEHENHCRNNENRSRCRHKKRPQSPRKLPDSG